MTDSQKLDLLLERTTAMAQDITELKEDMAEVKQRITNLEKNVSEMKQRITNLEKDVSEMKPRISNLEKDVKDLKEQMDYVKGDVKILKLNFENELRVSIKRVAEAHLDLSRNLKEAMKPKEEMEVLSIKVRKNESDIRNIYNIINQHVLA